MTLTGVRACADGCADGEKQQTRSWQPGAVVHDKLSASPRTEGQSAARNAPEANAAEGGEAGMCGGARGCRRVAALVEHPETVHVCAGVTTTPVQHGALRARPQPHAHCLPRRCWPARAKTGLFVQGCKATPPSAIALLPRHGVVDYLPCPALQPPRNGCCLAVVYPPLRG
jgi:hypothetical protein